MPRQNDVGGHVMDSQFAQEGRVIGAPGRRGLVFEIFDREAA